MARYENNRLVEIRRQLDHRETTTLCAQATPSHSGRRRNSEPLLAGDYRQAFAVDVDRILHSHAYTRYIDKTQVFSLIDNDHITHRVLHVQLVSKIARTIGRFLSLNEDLIEAIALGHDIGHAPFGHLGEQFLSALCLGADIGYFHHNVQSVQFLEKVECNAKGWNLCLQTLDGILCHDGEAHDPALSPHTIKSFADFDREIEGKTVSLKYPLTPMTLEGCVVRMADTIAYIGRDIEDAIRLGLIQRSDLPRGCVEILGDTNGTIVYTLVTDIIENSFRSPWVAFSSEVFNAMKQLKAFNYERIYFNPKIRQHQKRLKQLFELLFNRYIIDIETDNRRSAIFTGYLKDKSPDYRAEHLPAQIVRDFIAGMTDRFFIKQCPPDMRPPRGVT